MITIYVTRDLGDDAMAARECHVWRATGELISDGAARRVASWWQSPGRIGYVLAGLASGARVNVAELREDIAATIAEPRALPLDIADRTTLDALDAWARDVAAYRTDCH